MLTLTLTLSFIWWRFNTVVLPRRKESSRSLSHLLISSLLTNVNSCSRSLNFVARPSVSRLSVCLLSVTFVHPTQPVEIFGNISTPFDALANR